MSNGVTATDVLRGIDLPALPIAVLADMQKHIADAIHANLRAASERMWPSYAAPTVPGDVVSATQALPVPGGLFDPGASV